MFCGCRIPKGQSSTIHPEVLQRCAYLLGRFRIVAAELRTGSANLLLVTIYLQNAIPGCPTWKVAVQLRFEMLTEAVNAFGHLEGCTTIRQ